MTSKKAIHLVMPYELFFLWKDKNRLEEGQFTNRIISLIKADTILEEEEKERIEIEKEIKEAKKLILENQSKVSVLQVRLSELDRLEDEEQKQWEDDEMKRKIALARTTQELIARGHNTDLL